MNIWIQLTWQWLTGGPRLIRRLGSATLAAQRAQQVAEDQARDNRREVFKSWSLLCAASDGTIIRIRPSTFTIHTQGPVTEAVYQRLKQAWKESSLLIRLPFPAERYMTGYVRLGDWKFATYAVNEI